MSVAIHVNDIGTVLEFTVLDQSGVAVPLAGYTSLQILIKKPNKSVLTRTALLVTDGSDGKVKYTCVTGDFDAVGTYQFQVKVVLTTGTWHSDIVSKSVQTNLA